VLQQTSALNQLYPDRDLARPRALEPGEPRPSPGYGQVNLGFHSVRPGSGVATVALMVSV